MPCWNLWKFHGVSEVKWPVFTLMRHSKIIIAWYCTKINNTSIVSVHQFIQKQFLYQTFDIKAIQIRFKFANAVYKYLQDLKKVHLLYMYLVFGRLSIRTQPGTTRRKHRPTHRLSKSFITFLKKHNHQLTVIYTIHVVSHDNMTT